MIDLNDERSVARAAFDAMKKKGVTRLAVELGASEDDIEQRLLKETVRTTSICVTPADLQALEGLSGDRKLHMAACEFCTGVTEAMSQPVSPASVSNFLAELREQEKPLDESEILVVEDEEDARKFLTSVFTKAGAHVTSVGSAREALLQVKQKPRIDGLVSDIHLADPDLRNGYDVLSALQSTSRYPFFAIAVTADGEERAKSFAAGFNCFFEKPVDANTLTAAAFELRLGIMNGL